MEHNISIERTVPHGVTTPLPGLEHPSWPGQTIPAILDGHTPPTWCVYCDQLAGQIRASKRLGDWDGMVAYGWVAIRHVEASHGAAPAGTCRDQIVPTSAARTGSHRNLVPVAGRRVSRAAASGSEFYIGSAR